jgi:hypothetical protein
VVSAQFTPSYIDCFVWYHKKHIAQGINGTWFDNCSIGTIKRYDPDTGAMDTEFNQLARRQLMQRLATVNWQLMRRPCWLTNMHEDFSFADVIWLVENEWYIRGEGRTQLDNMPLDTFRALACTKTMQLVAKPWIHTPTKPDHPAYGHVMRSITGTLLAHDVQNGPLDDRLRRWLNFYVDFDSGRVCKFRGYWDAGDKVDTRAPDVKCSLYFNPRRQNAVLWFLNAGQEDHDLQDATFSADCFGRDAALRKAFDAETGAPVKVEALAGAKGVPRWRIAASFPVRSHEFRALAVGAEAE